MKKIFCVVALILFYGSAFAEESTAGYREVTKLYLNGANNAYFYLDENCPLGKDYYMLNETRVNVDRFYAAIMSAHVASKKVDVKWEANGVICEVTRIFVQ